MQLSGKGTQKQEACELSALSPCHPQGAQEVFPQPREGKADQLLTMKKRLKFGCETKCNIYCKQ